MSQELKLGPEARAAVRKQGAIHSWAMALADKRRRPVGEVLARIASLAFLDWESAVDQQQELRALLASLGCPEDLTSTAEWAALESVQQHAATESQPEITAWRKRRERSEP